MTARQPAKLQPRLRFQFARTAGMWDELRGDTRYKEMIMLLNTPETHTE